MKRDVSARIDLYVSEPASLIFAVAVAAAYRPIVEDLAITLDGAPVEATELLDMHGTRLHRVQAGTG